jgi:hypothetical protein
MLTVVAIVGMVLLVAHSVAQYGFLYWTYRWIDIPMHFLGGVWVALLSVYVLLHTAWGRGHLPQVAQRPFWIAVAGALVLGLLWEWYEIVFKFFNWGWFPDSYALDTLLDVVMDVLGGVLVGWGYMFARREK